MTHKEFEAELKVKDPAFEIRPNGNRPGLNNIFYKGLEICPVPDEMKEEHDPSYTYAFPGGVFAPHKSRQEALSAVESFLIAYNNGVYDDLD